jgi:Holliday junction resolvase-like predicted endonuclease
LERLPGSRRRGEKAVVSPTTGHVAESVAELVLQDDYGYNILWHLEPGIRGVDLIALSPEGDKVIAIEVKGRCGRGTNRGCRDIA